MKSRQKLLFCPLSQGSSHLLFQGGANAPLALPRGGGESFQAKVGGGGGGGGGDAKNFK